MAKLFCSKCGRELDVTPYGKTTKDNVIKLASDHASKIGCDYPSVNVMKVLAALKS